VEVLLLFQRTSANEPEKDISALCYQEDSFIKINSHLNERILEQPVTEERNASNHQGGKQDYPNNVIIK
jgi:hypothetical protein